MLGQLGMLLMSFRDALPREATFQWFVVAIFGFIIRLDHHGVSSSIRWLRVRETKTRMILCLDLLWRPLGDTLRFVLVKDGEQKFILICSDLSMLPAEIVTLYARRFKIELTFKMLKHVIGGFCYHFWTKAWPVPTGQTLAFEHLRDMPKTTQRRIADAMNAVEAFVNLAMIATGLLQVLAIEHAEAIRNRHQWWLRTYSSVIPSEEMVKTVIQHEFYHHFRKFKHTAIYRIIQAKRLPSKTELLKEAA